MNRIRGAALWLLPPVAALWLYRYGLKTWFFQDDFAWLQLAAGVLDGDGLLRALFTPMAQGTVRPLSERAFFIVFYWLFGLDGLPFRIWAFATQAANLALMGWIARRLTGSTVAALCAPVLWICGSGMYVVMTWNSAYNQALCAFCLLASFALLLRWTEGGRRYYRLQWLPYLAGFAALEITVVYPVLALGYTALHARRHVRRALWLLAPAVLFATAHFALIPKVTQGTYAMRIDFSMLASLWTYWEWALGPEQLAMVARLPTWFAPAATACLTVVLLGFAVLRTAKGDPFPAFFLFWFLATLAPVLPLRNHVSEYYLTVPTIGLAMLGAHGLSLAWRSGALSKALAAFVTLLYLGVSAKASAINTRATCDQSKRVKAVVSGVAYARQKRPSAVLVLSGVDRELFWNCVRDRAFRLVGAGQVYLPEAEAGAVGAPAEVVSPLLLPDEALVRDVEAGQVQVYDVRGAKLRNISARYKAMIAARAPTAARRVDVGNPAMSYALDAGWYPLENDFRWMGRRAGVRLAGPRTAAERLWISGRCPVVLLAGGPFTLRVLVDGETAGSASIRQAGDFAFDLPAPPGSVGKPATGVILEVERTYRPPNSDRDLGLVLGAVEIR